MSSSADFARQVQRVFCGSGRCLREHAFPERDHVADAVYQGLPLSWCSSQRPEQPGHERSSPPRRGEATVSDTPCKLYPGHLERRGGETCDAFVGSRHDGVVRCVPPCWTLGKQNNYSRVYVYPLHILTLLLTQRRPFHTPPTPRPCAHLHSCTMHSGENNIGGAWRGQLHGVLRRNPVSLRVLRRRYSVHGQGWKGGKWKGDRVRDERFRARAETHVYFCGRHVTSLSCVASVFHFHEGGKREKSLQCYM